MTGRMMQDVDLTVNLLCGTKATADHSPQVEQGSADFRALYSIRLDRTSFLINFHPELER